MGRQEIAQDPQRRKYVGAVQGLASTAPVAHEHGVLVGCDTDTDPVLQGPTLLRARVGVRGLIYLRARPILPKRVPGATLTRL